MSTTLLFVELLIIGIEVIIWLSIIMVTILDVNWIEVLSIKGVEGIVALVFLAIGYALGILFDRFADTVFSKAEERLKKEIFPTPPKSYVILRFQVAKGDEFLDRFFEYIRSRMRIARASAINLPLIAISIVISILVRGVPSAITATKIGLISITVAFAVVFTILAVHSWKKMIAAHLRLLKGYCETKESET